MGVCNFKLFHFLPLNVLETEFQLKSCFNKPTCLEMCSTFPSAKQERTLNLHHLTYAYKSTCIQLAEINEYKSAVDSSVQLFFSSK